LNPVNKIPIEPYKQEIANKEEEEEVNYEMMSSEFDKHSNEKND